MRRCLQGRARGGEKNSGTPILFTSGYNDFYVGGMFKMWEQMEDETKKDTMYENPTETATYTSPMRELELKWCNQIQALGWTETYQRRYLYMNAFDIVESDMFDAVAWDEKKAEVKKEVKRFNKEQFEKMKQNTEYLKKFKTSDELLKDIKKLWYSISDEMKLKVADARAEVPEDK